VSRWSQEATSGRVTVVTVPPRGSEPRLVSDRFAAAIGVDGTRLKAPDYDNSSVGAYSAELLRRLNEAAPHLERDHFRWGLKEALVRRSLASRAAHEPAFGLTAQQHEWVRRRAERIIADIQAAGTRVLGELGDLRPSEQAAACVDPASATDTDLVEAALQGLAGMVDVVAQLQREIQQAVPTPPPTPPIT
jgi:hypothetical protein